MSNNCGAEAFISKDGSPVSFSVSHSESKLTIQSMGWYRVQLASDTSGCCHKWTYT